MHLFTPKNIVAKSYSMPLAKIDGGENRLSTTVVRQTLMPKTALRDTRLRSFLRTSELFHCFSIVNFRIYGYFLPTDSFEDPNF